MRRHRADAGDFIRRNRHPEPRAADEEGAVYFALADEVCGCGGDVGVGGGVGGRGDADVGYGGDVRGAGEVLGEGGFVGYAGAVAADGDAEGCGGVARHCCGWMVGRGFAVLGFGLL